MKPSDKEKKPKNVGDEKKQDKPLSTEFQGILGGLSPVLGL